jgi:hypothetical protein
MGAPEHKYHLQLPYPYAIMLFAPNVVQKAPVAQLDRVFDYESKGRRFESCRAHHLRSFSESMMLSDFFICAAI